jgi:leader peptidase (prepilin peptidase) / N-methyltransferase
MRVLASAIMDATDRATPPAGPAATAVPSKRPSIVARARAEVAPYRRQVAWGGGVALGWALWASGPGPATPALLVAAVAGAALGVIDARTHRLPNAIVYPTLLVTALLLTVAGVVTGDMAALGGAGLGAAALGGGYLVLHLANPRGLGFGDVKFALLLGLLAGWWGWTTVWFAVVAPFFLGGVVSLVLLATRRATRHTAIPFGPFMLIGTALALTVARLS